MFGGDEPNKPNELVFLMLKLKKNEFKNKIKKVVDHYLNQLPHYYANDKKQNANKSGHQQSEYEYTQPRKI